MRINNIFATNYIFANGRRALRLNSDGSYDYFHTNYLGSSILIRKNSQSIWSRSFYPFGGEMEASGEGNKYGFTGKERDRETGLDYFWNRYYDKDLGRFRSVDPADEYHSPYIYCNNNPLRIVDNDGQYGKDVHYDLTLFMARRIGLPNATEIAKANHSVDKGKTHPWNPMTWFSGRSLHFESKASITAVNKLENMSLQLSPTEFGKALHSATDIKFAHKGFKPFGGKGGIGHVLWLNLPDNVYKKRSGNKKLSAKTRV